MRGFFQSAVLTMLLALSCVAAGQTAKRPVHKPAARSAAPASPLRTKVAEGRYQLRALNQGTMQSWDEPWTLYKTKTGFEIEEMWRASKEGVANSVNIEVVLTLAPGLYPTEARIGSDLTGNQLRCNMAMNEFRCTVLGKESKLPMMGAYNFFLPSPWFLTSIVRRAPKKPDNVVNVKLVQMAGMSPNGPKLIELSAQVAYVGEDIVELKGAKIPASIYEVRGTESPAIVVWLSADGVVLAMQDAAKPDQRMELVEFTKLAPI
jgi:hypothetical protein